MAYITLPIAEELGREIPGIAAQIVAHGYSAVTESARVHATR